MKNKRLNEKFGIHEGDRVRLNVMRDMKGPAPDWEYIKEICGTVYQIYQDFVVIMTRYGTHPSYFWSDFEKWRVG